MCVAVGLVCGGESPPPGSWLCMLSPAGWLPRVRDQLRPLKLDYEYGVPLPFTFQVTPMIFRTFCLWNTSSFFCILLVLFHVSLAYMAVDTTTAVYSRNIILKQGSIRQTNQTDHKRLKIYLNQFGAIPLKLSLTSNATALMCDKFTARTDCKRPQSL